MVSVGGTIEFICLEILDRADHDNYTIPHIVNTIVYMQGEHVEKLSLIKSSATNYFADYFQLLGQTRIKNDCVQHSYSAKVIIMIFSFSKFALYNGRQYGVCRTTT